jgi:hypothetical protein
MSAFKSTVANHDLPAGTKAVGSVLLVLLALTACSHVPTAHDLAGKWASIPAAGQAGATSATYCFGKDGAIEWTSQVRGRTNRVRGTFKLAGNVLTIESQDLDAPATMKTNMSLGKLELTSTSGSTQKYAKVGASCD